MSDQPQISIEIFTRAKCQRRSDWAIASATIHSPVGTYSGHTIHDFNGYGQLSVQAAPGSILHEETKQAILAEYRRVRGAQL